MELDLEMHESQKKLYAVSATAHLIMHYHIIYINPSTNHYLMSVIKILRLIIVSNKNPAHNGIDESLRTGAHL